MVKTVHFGRTCDAKSIRSQSARDNLRAIVEQASPRCLLLAGRIVEADRDGIALHPVDVHVIAHARSENRLRNSQYLRATMGVGAFVSAPRTTRNTDVPTICIPIRRAYGKLICHGVGLNGGTDAADSPPLPSQ